ncbi:hypothetical protein [Maribacter sp. 2-571]|uniref:hypothetical protein n=1 Tax=Maribacter sp. 2-571 TaxID=3417569 RepID=UPI003D347AB2
MKIKLCILFFILWQPSFCQDWVSTRITPETTIEFPVESELILEQGDTIYFGTDGHADYMVSLREISNGYAEQITPDNIIEFYEGTIGGMLRAGDGKLIAKEEIE